MHESKFLSLNITKAKKELTGNKIIISNIAFTVGGIKIIFKEKIWKQQLLIKSTIYGKLIYESCNFSRRIWNMLQDILKSFKPMIKINKKPIISHIIDRIQNSLKEFILLDIRENY